MKDFYDFKQQLSDTEHYDDLLDVVLDLESSWLAGECKMKDHDWPKVVRLVMRVANEF